MTELSIAITKALKKGKFKTLIFDSLSSMLIYHNAATVTKFAQNIIGKLRSFNCTTVFTCLEGDANSPLIGNLGMYVDEIIDIQGKKEISSADIEALKEKGYIIPVEKKVREFFGTIEKEQ